MAKKKSGKKAAGCRQGTVVFKTKRGKTVKFAGRTGTDCGPRKKPSTAHLKHYKTAFGRAARSCKGNKGRAFQNCMITQTRMN